MKKINLLLFVSIFTTVGFAQQFPLQSQYQFNYSSLNPAAVGENDYYSARASFRQQWTGFADKPIGTNLFTLTKGFGKSGLGVTVFSDKTGGAYNRSGVTVSYSHKAVFAGGSELYLGVSAGGAKVNFDLGPAVDEAIMRQEDMVPEATFGAYYKIKNFKVGISIPGMLNSNMELTKSNENTLDRHFYAMIAYQRKLNDQWGVYPSILVKRVKNQNQIDANVNFKLKNKLWFGTSYRQDFGPTLYVGIDLGRLLSVYSYDIATNEMSPYSNGSHELTIGYDFLPYIEPEPKKEEKINLFDKDKDGIEDKVDLCPDVPGDALANGCPDFDKDGIPNKYDLCPYLFGIARLQGCPDLTSDEDAILTKALGDLKFDFDKDEIKYSSYNALGDLTALMHKNPPMFLLIDGHASSEGTDKYNLNLSARRVKAVQQFFIKRGLERNRLLIDFYGEKFPLNTNATETERAENRRVEFDIKFHLYDVSAADNMKNEYDSLLNKLGSTDIIIEETTPEVEVKEADIEEIIPVVEVKEEVIEEIIPVVEVKEEVIEEIIPVVEVKEEIIPVVEVKEEIIENPKPDTTTIEARSETNGIESEDTTNAIEEVEEIEIEKDTTTNNIITPSEKGSNNLSEENNTFSKMTKNASKQYLLIVKVFKDAKNVINFVYDSTEEYKYEYIDEKYYVYVFSSIYREDVEMFRSAYNKDCWIKNPIKK
jgi:type IX secretion system PorP/SprF family membrane protein